MEQSPIVISSGASSDSDELASPGPAKKMIILEDSTSVEGGDSCHTSEEDETNTAEFDILVTKKIKKIVSSPIKTSLLTPRETTNDFYHNNYHLPVFSRQSSRFDTQEILSILLDPDLKEEHICKTQPVNVEHNSTFIVDLSLLGSPKDIYVDDMGSWKYNGVYRTWVTVESDGFMITHGKSKPSEEDDDSLYHLEKKYFMHKTSADLKKIIAILSDCNQELLNLALVQYAFDGVEHSVIPRPHGNSKKGDSYIRTMPSTMHKLKKVAVNLTPKFAVCEVSGDVLSAPSAGSLVRNRQQAKDLRRRKDEGQLVPVGKTKDPLFSVMLMCKESQGAKASDAFIRIVTCAPEPMAVLASDWTLNDLDRFCTKQHCTVFCIDPTFSLGDFSVTVTTYRHLMLCNSNEKHPVMMGPILIHKQKKFESYHFFASSLVGLKPSLRSLKVFGTDGEKAISNAMHVVFERAVHLRCFLHFKGNLDMKLREYGVPKSERMEFLRDVFGNPLELETGLVDAESEQEFEALVESVKDVWEQRESPYNSPPQFHSWFVKYCKDEVKDTMLKSKRIECGLGNPPEPFYTNDVESQNQVIKHQTQYKAKELPDFIATMQTMITNQKQEIERAVVGVGEYQLVDEYKHLKIPTRKFCQMTQMQKDKHLRSFFSSPLADSVQSEHEEEQKIESSQGENSNRITSSVPLNPLLQLDIPSHIAEKIWKEAEELLKSNPSKICLSPGCTESNEWLVKSSEQNHRHPYFVEIKDSGQILCEKSCMLYSSCKMCSHTVAVAYHTKSSQRYLKWMQKQKGSVSLSVLANANMPKGAGKKPNARRKASSKSATKRIKELIAEADSEQLTPRIKPSIKELTSSDEHNLMRTPALSDDMPGPSELSFSYSYPPPLRPAKSTWSPPSSSDYNQPLDHFGRQPPPLVSTGSLVQQVSMAYSPSANVVYAPVVSMSSSVDKDTFWLQFVRGNILRCNGCGKRDLRGEDGRPKPQPYDLCIQHKEHVLFENPHTGMYQMSADLRNVYYHARLQCVTQKNVHFNPGSALKISQEVKSKLSKVHFAYLLGEFGLSFLNQ